MTYLHTHGWILFLLSEGLTWLGIGAFFIFRYLLHFKRLSQVFLQLIILCTLFQVVLACIDYYYTGKISLFQIIIILFVLYGTTMGNSDFKRIDQLIQRRFGKNQHTLSKEDIEDRSIYTSERSILIFIHTLTLIIIHCLWFLLDFFHPQQVINFSIQQIQLWFESPHQGIFNEPFLNVIYFIWYIIYGFDLILFSFLFSIRTIGKKVL